MYQSEAVEQQWDAREALKDEIEGRSYIRYGATQLEQRRWKADVYILGNALPFYWNERTVQLVSQTMNDFHLEDIKASRHLVYTDLSWFYFPAGVSPFSLLLPQSKAFDGEVVHGEYPVQAISCYWVELTDSRMHIGATCWVMQAGHLRPALWTTVMQGDAMSEVGKVDFGPIDDRAIQEVLLTRRFVVAASTFLRQELLVVESQMVERHARKRLEKKHLNIPSLVQVVQLRKTQHTRSETSTPSPVDWQWQWSVKGHVRQQYYPSLGEHLPVVITPYLKGPEDKPLKPRTTPIYSVTR